MKTLCSLLVIGVMGALFMWAQPRTAEADGELPPLTVTSSSVDAKGFLLPACTCDGTSESPAVAWKGAPRGTKSFAVRLWHVAPDREKNYWIVYDIPATVSQLVQNSQMVGRVGANDKRRTSYDPMCSKGTSTKTYHITVYALSAELNLAPETVDRNRLLAAIRDITLAEGTFDYQYQRKK